MPEEGEQPPVTAGNLLPPGASCRDDTYQPYPFDPAKAQEFLAQSTYGDGASVPRIRITTEGSESTPEATKE